jgi:hypothetical protein
MKSIHPLLTPERLFQIEVVDFLQYQKEKGYECGVVDRYSYRTKSISREYPLEVILAVIEFMKANDVTRFDDDQIYISADRKSIDIPESIKLNHIDFSFYFGDRLCTIKDQMNVKPEVKKKRKTKTKE